MPHSAAEFSEDLCHLVCSMTQGLYAKPCLRRAGIETELQTETAVFKVLGLKKLKFLCKRGLHHTTTNLQDYELD